MLCKIACCSRSMTNVTANLRRCIQGAGAEFPVEIQLVRTTIRLRKPKPRIQHVYWPVLSIKSWCQVLSKKYPEYLFGGYQLADEENWRRLFEWFWEAYRVYDPSHPVYSDESFQPQLSIPIMSHGDEGRGLRFTPFMVQAWQTVVSVHGPEDTNTSGRLGFCVLLVARQSGS